MIPVPLNTTAPARPQQPLRQRSHTSAVRRWASLAALVLLSATFGGARADLLGVALQFQEPKTELDGAGSLNYTAATRAFSLTAGPYVTAFTPGSNTFWDFGATRTLTLNFTVGVCTPSDTAAVNCEAISGSDRDIVITGTIPGQYSGELLTGRIVAFGAADSGSRTDFFDFRFVVTGGTMADLFVGRDLGLSARVEGSTFVGSFAQNITSTTNTVKGTFAAIPGTTTEQGIASLGDRVWEDLNADGIQNCPDANADGIIGNESEADLTGNGYVVADYPECFSGLIGVPVELFDAGDDNVCDPATDASLGTTNTVDGGFYAFEQLDAGNYCVQVTRPTDICDLGDSLFTSANQGTDNEVDSDVGSQGITEIVVLGENQANTSLDAGVVCPARIGDRLWDDGTMQNNQQDAGEPGIEGQDVTLYRCIDGARDANWTPITTQTGTDGLYFFDVLPGTYEVVFSLPADTTVVAQNFLDLLPGNDAIDSDIDFQGSTGCNITVASNEEDLTWDAGVFTPIPEPKGSVGDRLFLDANRDGIQNPGELGVNGDTYPATATLYSNCDTTPVLVGTLPINASGNYLFEELDPGTYCVEFSLPEICEFGQASFTSKDVVDGLASPDERDSDVDLISGRTDAFALGVGENDLTRDAGIYCPARIGDLFWDDTAMIDGQQGDEASEPGISGVTVNLYACLNNVVQTGVLDSTTTDAFGGYGFDVDPGSYAVEFVIPADLAAIGYVYTSANQGDDISDSDADRTTGLTACSTVASGEEDLTIDGGAFQTATSSLGDTCFHDQNENGIQDQGEPGVEGCTVELFENPTGGVCAANPDDLLGTVATSGGLYSYENLSAGNYCLRFTPPAGFCDSGDAVFSPIDQGDDALDSDVNGSGLTGNIALGANQQDLTWDAGIYCPGDCPTPVIDGTIDDWDLSGDLFANMYEAGNPSKELLSKAYVRYSDGTLYVMVLTEPGIIADQSAGDAWVKVYDLSNSTQVDGSSSTFDWLYNSDGELIGYEASFPLAAGTYAEVEIHLSVGNGRTSSTGKKKQGYIELTTVESCPIGDDGGNGGDDGGNGGDDGDSGDDGTTGDDGDSGICATWEVDGEYGDWDLGATFLANMYEAGKSNKEHLSTAYSRYADGTLQVLVLTTAGNIADASADDAWVKIYDLGNSTQVDGDSSSFVWVYDADGRRIGYEASFDLAAGTYDSVEIHLNVNRGDTSSTGKKRNTISLTAAGSCPAP